MSRNGAAPLKKPSAASLTTRKWPNVPWANTGTSGAPAERKQFVDLFASLLENSYASKIESYNNEKVVYIKEID